MEIGERVRQIEKKAKQRLFNKNPHYMINLPMIEDVGSKIISFMSEKRNSSDIGFIDDFYQSLFFDGIENKQKSDSNQFFLSILLGLLFDAPEGIYRNSENIFRRKDLIYSYTYDSNKFTIEKFDKIKKFTKSKNIWFIVDLFIQIEDTFRISDANPYIKLLKYEGDLEFLNHYFEGEIYVERAVEGSLDSIDEEAFRKETLCITKTIGNVEKKLIKSIFDSHKKSLANNPILIDPNRVRGSLEEQFGLKPPSRLHDSLAKCPDGIHLLEIVENLETKEASENIYRSVQSVLERSEYFVKTEENTYSLEVLGAEKKSIEKKRLSGVKDYVRMIVDENESISQQNISQLLLQKYPSANINFLPAILGDEAAFIFDPETKLFSIQIHENDQSVSNVDMVKEVLSNSKMPLSIDQIFEELQNKNHLIGKSQIKQMLQIRHLDFIEDKNERFFFNPNAEKDSGFFNEEDIKIVVSKYLIELESTNNKTIREICYEIYENGVQRNIGNIEGKLREISREIINLGKGHLPVIAPSKTYFSSNKVTKRNSKNRELIFNLLTDYFEITDKNIEEGSEDTPIVHFREMVINKLKFCPITGSDSTKIIDIFPIKPLLECSEVEKKDINNFLVLSKDIGKLFKTGLISFYDDKRLIVSESIPENYKNSLLESNKIITNLPIEDRGSYLKYHRDNVLKKLEEDHMYVEFTDSYICHVECDRIYQESKSK